MANYNSLKNASVLATPVSNIDLGSPTNRYGNVFLSGNLNMNGTSVNSANILGPKITGITYPGDDTAADTAGGQSVIVSGTGFAVGASVLVNGVSSPAVTYVNSSTISFTTPAMSAGTYTLYVINTDGGVAIGIPGISYSGTPAWSTAAGSLGTNGQGSSVSISVASTGDAPITYAVTSGALPSGLSLNATTGAITGTAPNPPSTTTYSFTITAKDAQNQTTDRAFSITISTFVSATGGTVTTVGNYKIHTFTGNGTFTVTSGGNIQYLAVGGGGAGGTGYYGGGGGAGGVNTGTQSFDGTTYTITVGSGGVGTSNQGNRGGNGANTTIAASGFTTLIGYGGGGGGSRNNDAAGGNAGGAAGGSGGGASFINSAGGAGVYPGSSYISATRQGYDGGTNPAAQYAAGGGGAAGVGHDGTNFPDRRGGHGIPNPIAGSTIGENDGSGSYYIAGGGGGGYTYGTYGLGGGSASSGGNRVDNTGGGGAGGNGNNAAGETGGVGLVIFKYQFQ